MSEKLNNQRVYNIEPEMLHLFLVSCDRIDVDFYKVLQYSTQLSILSDAYYNEQYDREIVCDCICSSIEHLSNIISDEYDLILKSRKLHDELLGIE